jgi:hypothetical protein
LGDFFEIISILEVEIGRNGPGILGVKKIENMMCKLVSSKMIFFIKHNH